VSSRLDKIERGLALLALAVGVLGFGAAGLCGGFFTAWMMPAVFQRGGAEAVVMLLLSVPCLMGGLLMVKICVDKIRQLIRPQATDKERA
jgi:TRAP-type C4-dicarboxylate transport system permease small subunit